MSSVRLLKTLYWKRFFKFVIQSASSDPLSMVKQNLPQSSLRRFHVANETH